MWCGVTFLPFSPLSQSDRELGWWGIHREQDIPYVVTVDRLRITPLQFVCDVGIHNVELCQGDSVEFGTLLHHMVL